MKVALNTMNIPPLPISNDVPLHLELSMSDLYAYDTTVHYSSNLVSNITMKLNRDMQNEAQWCNDQDMVLILKKPKSMLIGTNSGESRCSRRVSSSFFL
jgi:hypothetical protein